MAGRKENNSVQYSPCCAFLTRTTNSPKAQ